MTPAVRHLRAPLRLALACALSTACGKAANGTPDAGSDPVETTSPYCSGTSLTPFKAGDATELEKQTQAHLDLLAAAELASVDASKAADQFKAVEDLYRSSGLEVSVKAATDVRFGAPTPVALGDKASAAISAGKAATTDLEVQLATDALDDAVLEAFAYTALQELSNGSRTSFDRAVALFGASKDNADEGRKGISRFAAQVDVGQKSAFAPVLFGILEDAQCELDKGLTAANSDALPAEKLPSYKAVTDRFADRLAATFAQGVLQALSPMPQQTADVAKASLRDAEALYAFVRPALTNGGKASAAADVDAQFGKADSAIAAASADWNAADKFDYAKVRTALAGAFKLTLPEAQ